MPDASPATAVRGWRTAHGTLSLDRPVIAGILNLTPDSFSDGGRYLDPVAALRHAGEMVEQGADLIDVGAESTRPGRPDPVPADEEWARLDRVLPELSRHFPGTPVSVDTNKATTAERALDAGAWAINDVTGLRGDPRVGRVCAAAGAGLILMHSRGSLRELATYDHAGYEDVADEVATELAVCVSVAEGQGVSREHLILDPGLGFAKRPEHNYQVLRGLGTIAALGFPVMVGPSRKRFLSAVSDEPVDARDAASAAACVAAYFLGARLFRVHDVRRAREALAIAHAIRTA